MKSTQGQLGRVFVIRLEDGDKLPDCIEQFALEKSLAAGHVILLGGVDKGQIVVGPENSTAMPPEPVLLELKEAHEIIGLGLLAPDEDGKPVLHMHASMGRGNKALTGCIRPGIFTWLVGEVIVYEITGTTALRKMHQDSGFVLLEVD
jgi:predicted DNA-binding protein with PD1-like motif